MESPVNATLATTEMSMEIVSRATSSPNVMKMKDMMLHFKLVSVSLELNTSEEDVKISPTVLPTHTITPSAAFVTQDSSSTVKTDVSQSTLSSLNAPPTLNSMESHAPATSESSNKLSTHVLLAHLELNGTVKFVIKFPLRLVPQVMSSTKISTSVNLLLLHVETTPTTTVLLVFA